MIDTYVAYFWLWLMCGIAAAIVASNKGRSGFGWFFLGFFLGPFGFILSLIVSKNATALEKSAIQSGAMKKCPFCAELVKVEAALCKHCGKELPEIVPPAQEEIIQPAKNVEEQLVIRVCSSCRATNNAAVTECFRCGSALPA
jgi:hypothetical protein